ncbi:bombesin receptor-activated protein C6orf89 homolog isoform X1 [Petromyzon marinus]|uniref:Uncharacterized protein LOC116947048 isoform X2 n=1 Tax=Petromyzon marinus TaxID=7757 RepID=A0AAJ7X1Z4_PETMA|nr:uncharacterized protein LOC116947048 isoform X2 [Petromyzon marinus]
MRPPAPSRSALLLLVSRRAAELRDSWGPGPPLLALRRGLREALSRHAGGPGDQERGDDEEERGDDEEERGEDEEEEEWRLSRGPAKRGLEAGSTDRALKVLAVPLVLLLTYYACLWLHPPTQQLVSRHTQRWVYNALRRVRLLTLPITRRYNLAAYHDQECLVYNPLYSDPTPNCSFCAAVKSVILLDEFSNFTQYYYGQADPVLVKGGQKDHVGLEDVQHLHAVHGKTLDLRPDEVSCSNDSVSSFSHLFRLFPTEETLARSSTTFQWKTQRVAGTRLLRELFPRPYFISPDSEVSLLKLLILQGSQATPHALVFQLQFYNAWLAIGSGSLSLHLTPVPACHAPCRTLSVHAQAGDLVYYSTEFWRAAVVPNGADPCISFLASFY